MTRSPSNLMCTWFAASCVLATLIGCAPRTQPGLNINQFTGTYTRKVTLDYLLYLPSDYVADCCTYRPVIVFLHGAGERGHDLELLKQTGLPKQLAAGREFPFIIIAPQCPPGQWWRPDEVIALLDHVLNWVNGDPDRIYLTGLSMGGTGTWLTAAEYPDRFAAIAPICGRSLPIRAPAVKNLPIWVFHGDADTVVPLDHSQQHVERLRAAGAEQVRFTIIPGGPHNVWDDVYAGEDLYAWFLQHRRSP